MRTAEQAREILLQNIPLIIGEPLSDNFFLNLNENEGGMSHGYLERSGDSFKLIGLDIAPIHYWQKLSENGLTSIPAQEIAHNEFIESAPVIMKQRQDEIAQVEIDHPDADRSFHRKLRNQIRERFEQQTDLLVQMLSWKLAIDKRMVEILQERNFPTSGTIELLEAERDEEAKVEPSTRRSARINVAQIRIEHIAHLISRDSQRLAQAEKIRQFYKELIEKNKKDHSQ